MSKHIYVHDGDHVSGWAVLIVASLIFAFAKWLLLFAFVLVFAWAAGKAHTAWRVARAKRQAELAALRARADYENWLAVQGDPLGVYGDYTPPTLPLVDPPEWYDYDYDNGSNARWRA